MIIRVVDQDQSQDLPAEPGTNLMTFLRRHGHVVSAPCGGRGTCGKCLVEVDGLGPVLACQTVIGRDVPATGNAPSAGDVPAAGNAPSAGDVPAAGNAPSAGDVPSAGNAPSAGTVPAAGAATAGAAPAVIVRLPRKARALILIDGLMPDLSLDPLVRSLEAIVPAASLECQLADDERFLQAAGYSVPFRLLPELPERLAEADGRVRFIGRADTRTVLRFLPASAGMGSGFLPGVAIDIGTTTLAAYLYNLHDGRRLASAALGNPQAAFGADVISRIARSTASPADAAELRQAIRTAISQLVVTLMNQADEAFGQPQHSDDRGSLFRPERLALLSLAGNTTMMHLLTGLPAGNIARAPFNPVSVQTQIVPAADLHFAQFPAALVVLLPSVASYVGADITAGVIALGLEKPAHETAILIDIGTNGEIVLRAGERLTACATAAGPAFEGASISAGMSGTSGAIDHVWLDSGDIRYSVITSQSPAAEPAQGEHVPADRPSGICGSGLVDTVAALLASGVIDETGRIGAEPERLTPDLRDRLLESGGQPAFLVAGAGETSHGRPILLTQKDIRELQNAKAAIAAGIQLLLRREGVAPGSVATVYLAGGFGQYLNVRSAQAIGLLPEGLGGRTIAVGNTSAMGAIAALLDRGRIDTAAEAARHMLYRELSSDPEFSDLFIDALLFPEPA